MPKTAGTGIVMDVNTGAIIAMASYPNYDLQDSYGSCTTKRSSPSWTSQLAELAKNRADYATEEDYEAAVSTATS